MRSVRYLLHSEGGYFDQWDLQAGGLHLQAIHNVEVMADGSVIILFEAAEPAEEVRAICDERLDGVFDWQVSKAGDRTRFQVHHVPAETLGTVIRLHRTYPVVTDYPIEYVEPGRPVVRVEKVGRETNLYGMLREMRELTDVEIEQIGTYEPGSRRLVDQLTDRQVTVLKMAVDLGYYDIPRRSSCEEIGEELSCSAGTISQHLRRIEAKILSGVVERGEPKDLEDLATA